MVNTAKIAQKWAQVGFLFVIEKYMFSKVKNIKHKIKLVKYGAIVLAVIFVLQLATTIYLWIRVIELQEEIDEINYINTLN